MSEKTYLTVAQTAALLRQALKECFPGVKFSVRSESYSMGACINVGWTDGPATSQVKAIAGLFQGAYFDGMIDYKGAVYHYLDGKRVKFGADSVHCNRQHSDEAIQRSINAIARNTCTAQPLPSVADIRTGHARQFSPMANEGQWSNHWSWGDMVYRDLYKRTRILALPCPTAARIKFAGDDGYGQGTVGTDGKPGEQAYACENRRKEEAATQVAPARVTPVLAIVGGSERVH